MRQRDEGGWGGACVMAAAGLVAVAVLAGCESTPPAAAAADGPVRADVADIKPMGPLARSDAAADVAAAPAAYAPPLYDTSGPIPTAPQAVTEPAPAPAPAPPPEMPARSTPPAGPQRSAPARGRTHVVRRGETLFAIARSSYGDGRKWHRLAAANPAAAAAPLRVGEQIVVP